QNPSGILSKLPHGFERFNQNTRRNQGFFMISGKALPMMDRSCLKDIGITSIGKQLTILGHIKQLLGKGECQPKESRQPNVSMKGKITKKDKNAMTSEEKHLYHSKIQMIRKECEKRWPGNHKIYFRSNNSNSYPLRGYFAISQ
ncbi:unnamed protein product, partial [Porites lobata]